MDYTKLGHTGLDISRLCLGCMGFGNPARGFHQWVLNEKDAEPVIKHALEIGINFFDTANMYAEGTSEEVLGSVLKKYANRDQIVIATKVFNRMHEGPNGAGLSRKAIMSEIDKSLIRLQTDYVDLYQIHRWDYHTPIEETMEALHDLVKAGKVRYIGASAMYAWQFQKALYIAEKHGWTKFVSMQNHLNLIYREEEREMLPLCKEEKIGVIPYSPLAGGKLAREKSTDRELKDKIAIQKYIPSSDIDQPIIDRQKIIAEKYGVPRAHIALAWLLQKEPVNAPIVGATKQEQLDDAKAALSLTLTDEDILFLEELYVPHRVVGHV